MGAESGKSHMGRQRSVARRSHSPRIAGCVLGVRPRSIRAPARILTPHGGKECSLLSDCFPHRPHLTTYLLRVQSAEKEAKAVCKNPSELSENPHVGCDPRLPLQAGRRGWLFSPRHQHRAPSAQEWCPGPRATGHR